MISKTQLWLREIVRCLYSMPDVRINHIDSTLCIPFEIFFDCWFLTMKYVLFIATELISTVSPCFQFTKSHNIHHLPHIPSYSLPLNPALTFRFSFVTHLHSTTTPNQKKNVSTAASKLRMFFYKFPKT